MAKEKKKNKSMEEKEVMKAEEEKIIKEEKTGDVPEEIPGGKKTEEKPEEGAAETEEKYEEEEFKEDAWAEHEGEIVPELQIVVFKLGEEEFAANIMDVREITRYGNITYIPGALDFIEGVINLRGDVIAVMDLNMRLGLGQTHHGSKTRIVITEVNERVMGIVVDSVTEVLKVPEKNIDESPSIITDKIHESYISGVGKINKRLLIILSLKNVLSKEEVIHVDEIKKKHIEQIKK